MVEALRRFHLRDVFTENEMMPSGMLTVDKVLVALFATVKHGQEAALQAADAGVIGVVISTIQHRDAACAGLPVPFHPPNSTPIKCAAVGLIGSVMQHLATLPDRKIALLSEIAAADPELKILNGVRRLAKRPPDVEMVDIFLGRAEDGVRAIVELSKDPKFSETMHEFVDGFARAQPTLGMLAGAEAELPCSLTRRAPVQRPHQRRRR